MLEHQSTCDTAQLARWESEALRKQNGLARLARRSRAVLSWRRCRTYWIELATCEKMLFDLPPISFTVPITTTRITANITAYSATS